MSLKEGDLKFPTQKHSKDAVFKRPSSFLFVKCLKSSEFYLFAIRFDNYTTKTLKNIYWKCLISYEKNIISIQRYLILV